MGTILKGGIATLILSGFFGGLLLLAFEPIGLYPLAWVCLIPLLAFSENESWFERLLRGYIFGIAFYGIGLSWLPAGIVSFSDFAIATSWASFALILVFLALFPAAFQCLLGYFPGNRSRLLVVAPSLWVALEAIRANSWGGLPWLDLATTQVQGPLTGLIPIIGGVGINFLLVFMNSLLLLLGQEIWRNKLPKSTLKWIMPPTLLLFILLGSAFLQNFSWVEPKSSPIQVGMVQAGRWDAHELSPGEREQLFASYRDLAKEVSPRSDVVILPESAIWRDRDKWSRKFREEIKKGTVYIVGSMEKTLGGDRYNSVFLFRESGRDRYRKQRPVPVGESRPPWIVAPLVGPVGGTGNHVLPGSIQAPLQWQDTKFGVLVCWEIRFPSLVTDHLLAGTDILINPANESWLDSEVAKERSLAAARMRAAESGRMLLRVANWGLSAVIGPRGEIRARLSGRQEFTQVRQAKIYAGNTPYIALRLENRLKIAAFVLVAIVSIYACSIPKFSFPGLTHSRRMQKNKASKA